MNVSATIFESLGQHSAGLEVRLKKIAQIAVADPANGQKQLEALLQGIPALPGSETQPHDLLLRVLTAWKDLSFPVPRLEAAMISNPALLILIGTLLEHSGDEDSDSPIAGIEFSSDFYFAATEASVRAGDAAHAAAVAADTSRTSTDRLWAQIQANLEKDHDKRFRLIIPQVELRDHYRQKTAAALLPGDVAFTCGHLFTEKAFDDEILPLFREKVAGLPVPLPLTSKLLVADYQLSMINAACPACVFNYLRERHAVPGKPAPEKWVV